ncbi:MAG: DUF2817 domain-containing protein [Anaerolineae bacterium]|nr:DUF2817 domain-containing protein [Anaerolineae bacterium]
MRPLKPFSLILLLFCAACQPAPAEVVPLPTTFPTFAPATPAPLPTRRVASAITLIPTHTPSPAPTLTPLASPTPAPSATPEAERVFGQSAEGRDLTVYRIGAGERAVLLVGAVHGGFESNTAALMSELVAHYRAQPESLPADVSLWVVPMLNPDGVARGRVIEGRFNANGVDLNRNWPCGWQREAYFRDQVVSAGDAPLSEPETRALADLITAVQPAASLFYHAAAAGVYGGACGGDAGSAALSAAVGQAAGYDYGESFSAYPVTGTAPAWVNSLGLAAADVELATATETEFERNLAGVQAAACWVSALC